MRNIWGNALLQKNYTVDFLNKKRIKNMASCPQYYVENDHSTIIPRSVFIKVQNLIHQRHNGITTKNGRHRRVNGKYCFSQRVYCEKCGDIFQRTTWYNPLRSLFGAVPATLSAVRKIGAA